ncbi:MAG TPA: glycoside hydrolase family 99-like domain-containing protein [Rhodocyclaceae bacterium]|nr:glycoside hydrolase family 99-like domain-containing protein [Rhodocyclaceae bacterium]
MSKKKGKEAARSRRTWKGTRFAPQVDCILPHTLLEPARARIAVVLHLFYTDTWDEFAEYLERIPEAFDLYVSVVSDADRNAIEPAILKHVPNARLFVHPNRGRDVGPFITLLGSGTLDPYDAVCKLHSKSSRYSEHGSRWRHDILERLLPDPVAIGAMIAGIRGEGGVGLVGPDAYLLTEGRYWKGCADRVKSLCACLGVPESLQKVEFFAGTMFWFRPEALSLLANAGIELQHFEPEAGQRNETFAHVVERIFTLVARTAGFAIADTREPAIPIPFRDYRKAKAHILEEMMGEGAEANVRTFAALPSDRTGTNQPAVARIILVVDARGAGMLGEVARHLRSMPFETHLILLSHTSVPEDVRAALASLARSMVLLARTDTPLFSLIRPTLARLEPGPSDLMIRLSLDFDELDQTRRHAFIGFAGVFLEPVALKGMAEAIANDRRIGMIVPTSAPAMNLWAAEDGSFVEGLAQKLAIPLAAFDEASYYPDAIYCIGGQVLADLLQKHLSPADGEYDAAVALAAEIGLAAIVKAGGRQVIEIRTAKMTDSDGGANERYTRQILRSPGDESRAPEYRQRTYRKPGAASPLKVIAYYLPQFHPIPENDAWWGTGFTEWHNVTRAVPRFVGHYQPHLPADLGFYDLRMPQVLHQQVELARSHGVHGFCFYYYWFNGTRLLETPIENYHADRTLTLPYCLCWANENWTRRWDGQDKEILMAQAHSARDDLRFIASIEKFLADDRYIRVDGKPLLLIYRANQLADARATGERWRKHCRDAGLGEIYLAAVRSFGITDPRPYGFDAAVEFPPHGLNQPPITAKVDMIDPDFGGIVYDYRDAVMYAASEKYAEKARTDYPVFAGSMLSWDNDARRRGTGHVFHNASPQAYANWLRLAGLHSARVNNAGDTLVFVNAWNEWAEGTHLEPDRRYGHAYLTATADTVALFAPHEDPVRNDSPASLGFASPLLDTIPAHLVPRRGPVELALYRDRLAHLGQAPKLRMILPFGEMGIGVLDTLYTLAEQRYTRLCLSVITPERFRCEWAQPIPCVHYHQSNLIAGMNQAVADCDEEWLVFLEKSDQLLPHSLLAIATELAANHGIVALYTDECSVNEANGRTEPVLKPDFDPVRLEHQPYVGGLLVVRRSAFLGVGGFDERHAGFEQHDLVLRLFARHGANSIRHLPEILVWRRTHPASRSLRPDALPMLEARIRDEHRSRSHSEEDPADQATRVTIIIPTREQPEALKRCVESIFATVQDTCFDLIVVDHLNHSDAARGFLDGLRLVAPERIRIVEYRDAFNIAAINNAGAASASGSHLLFLNDDTAALHPEWLDRMLEEAKRTEVGIVGCRLVFPDGRLQHAGIVLGLSGVADFAWNGAPMDAPGRSGELRVPHVVSAVTGACMLVKRSVFDAAGGFDPGYSLAYADLDLCLRAKQLGYLTVFTPHATLMHEAGRTLKAQMQGANANLAEHAFATQQTRFLTAWRRIIARDPAYHPALSLNSRKADLEPIAAFAPDPISWTDLPRVLALPADREGSGAYRVIQPANNAHMIGSARARVADGYPLPIMFERLDIDTLFTQRQVDDAQLAALAGVRTTTDARVVMDFDDLLSAVPDSSIHKQAVWPDIERRVAEACALSHAITVSTAPLAREMLRFHDDVRVVPNAIDTAVWRPELVRDRPPGTRLRVGWAGGVSHAGDLALLREVVKTLADEVEWVFLGMCLEDMRPHLTEFHRGVPFADYPSRLAGLGLDLALAPLAINRFNECKSNLRLLEYGILGIPVIATDIVPYQCGLPVALLPNDAAAWTREIRARIGASDALRADGSSLRDAILQNWTVDTHLPGWVSAWTRR